MAYINDMNPDRFSLDYLLQENFYDKDSVLISSNFLASLDEAQKMELADMMGGRITRNSGKKLANLNRKGTFLDLPKCNGDIKKSKMYIPAKQALSLLKPIIEKAKGKNTVEAITAFQTCEASFGFLEKNVEYFKRAYSSNDSANILAFQSIAIAAMEFASIILINCTAITELNNLIYRDPPRNSLMKNILYKNLDKFNDICRNNKLKLNEEVDRKLEEYEMVYNENPLMAAGAAAGLKGMGTAALTAITASTPGLIALGAISVVSGLMALIYLSRTLICYFYYKKVEIGENLKYISGMVEANGMAVANGSPKDKKVGARQSNLASKLKSLGEKLDNDNKQAQHNCMSALKNEDQKISRSIEVQINPDNRQEVTPRNNNDNLGDNLFI